MSELTALRDQREADIQHAVGQTVVQYREQLESERTMQKQRDRETSTVDPQAAGNKSVPWKFL